ncbi:hypothetical protein BGZ65_010459, partial [Modicella reniformis]
MNSNTFQNIWNWENEMPGNTDIDATSNEDLEGQVFRYNDNSDLGSDQYSDQDSDQDSFEVEGDAFMIDGAYALNVPRVVQPLDQELRLLKELPLVQELPPVPERWSTVNPKLYYRFTWDELGRM